MRYPFQNLAQLVSLFLVFLGAGGAQSSVLVPANDSKIQYSGRIDSSNPLSPRFDWPGVSILAVFQGTSVGVLLTDGGNNYNAFIDGTLNQVVATGPATQYNISGLSAGTHTLLLTKRTEGYAGVGTFNGLVLEDGMTLLTPPPPPSRRIEYVGDSITCGYGNESTTVTCNAAQYRATENNWLTYAALSARSVCAEFHITAYSGKGMVRNYGDPSPTSTNPMPSLYPQVLVNQATPTYNFSQWIPNAVVIFLGNNDFSTAPQPSQATFENGYKSFIATLRSNYPAARIFCLSYVGSSPMAAYVSDVVTQENGLGDTNIQYVGLTTPVYPGQLTGCDYHPNLSSHQQSANELAAALNSGMGWASCATLTPTFSPTPIVSSTPTSTATYSPTLAFTFTSTNTNTPSLTSTASATPTFTFTATLTPTGTLPTATNTPSLTATASLTNTPTLTSTGTASPSPTNSFTQTGTNTMTWTPGTPTSTYTLSNTPVMTWTGTPTAAHTPAPVSSPAIYPNPFKGQGVIHIASGLTNPGDVKVQIFTTAFRKVYEKTFPQIPAGGEVTWNGTDNWGTILSNGVYLVVVIRAQSRSVGKLLMLR